MLTLILTQALAAASPTSTDLSCAPELLEQCEARHFLLVMPFAFSETGGDAGDGGDLRQCDASCEAFGTPLPQPIVTCVRTLSYFECEVWPQGTDLSYSWTSHQGVDLLSNSLIPHAHFRTPYQAFFCTQSHSPGFASIVITAPGGGSSRRDFFIPCASPGSLPAPVEPIVVE